jgi:4-hydroxy-3-polyprenylbenzoate decarboxylase
VGRYVIVVDEDIDPSNTDEVLWAISTRTDPAQSIEILKRCWSSSADPMLPPTESPEKVSFNSRAIIDACRPYEWMDKFPPVVQASSSLKEKLIAKIGRDRLGI